MQEEKQLICLDDFETRARKLLPLQAWIHYSTGAEDELTLGENRNAFRRYWLKPRVLRDVSVRDLSTTILGVKVDAPICMSPTGIHSEAHPDGEIATCRAAADMNTLMTVSVASSKSIEDIASASPASPKWLNVYIWRHRGITKDLVERAERAGCRAIVVTVDQSEWSIRRVFKKARLGDHYGNVHYGTLHRYIRKNDSLEACPRELTMPFKDFTRGDPCQAWEDIAWLKTLTQLPIVVKGILTVEDAILAAERGAQAIIVSNHGGRQLDGVPATIDVLEEIADAVGDKLEVYMDGGVRTGTDILKALALGAKAVFIGRPVLYGLACGGEDGVKRVLQILRDELSRAMALTGCRRLNDISKDLIYRRGTWSKL